MVCKNSYWLVITLCKHVSFIANVGGCIDIDTYGCVVGELSLALVVSSKAHAQLIKVDASDALQMPGVVDFISHKDVPGENCFGSIVPDQTIFAVDKV